MVDVIVVGAGPAGCTAAAVLAQRGFRVVLAEKFRLPRYKSCSGILIKKSLDLTQRYFGGRPSEEVTCAPAENRGMIFTDDRGREYRFQQEGLNVWRGAFDHWLALRAAERGAAIWEGTPALSCLEEDGVVKAVFGGKRPRTETARYLLDCEGVVGVLKRKLLKRPTPTVTTFQTFCQGSIDLDEHYFYAYLQPELSEYDAWFNVKAHWLALGVAVQNPARIRDFYERFIHYMQTRHRLRIERQVKAERWLMPRILPGCAIDYGCGRVLFAGEAAGFLNPMGEGISAGMESGAAAAHAVADHFEDPDEVPMAYRRYTQELKAYMERQWSLTASMAGTFSDMKR